MPANGKDVFEIWGADRTSDITALLIGIAGETGSGKTVSAIRLALGICRVVGGKPCVIDTEALRALNYRKPRGPYDFDYIDFQPPFSPPRYQAAIETAVQRGFKVIVCDSMSHEHSGSGGIIDQIDRFLDEKCGEDFQKREKMNMVAHARIKPQRKRLNDYIIQLARKGVVLILCYRANDKVKPVTGKGIVHVGFAPETTSPLRFEMTQGFLLMPGSKGTPTVSPETADEKIWSKTPMQFEKWICAKQLDEGLGEKLAKWAVGDAGGSPAIQTAPKSPASQPRPSPEAGSTVKAPVLPPLCPQCRGGMNLIPAGTKTNGDAYQAFYKCKLRACRGTALVPVEQAAATEEAWPDPPTEDPPIDLFATERVHRDDS